MILNLNFTIIGKGKEYSSEALAPSLKALQSMLERRAIGCTDSYEFTYINICQPYWHLT